LRNAIPRSRAPCDEVVCAMRR